VSTLGPTSETVKPDAARFGSLLLRVEAIAKPAESVCALHEILLSDQRAMNGLLLRVASPRGSAARSSSTSCISRGAATFQIRFAQRASAAVLELHTLIAMVIYTLVASAGGHGRRADAWRESVCQRGPH